MKTRLWALLLLWPLAASGNSFWQGENLYEWLKACRKLPPELELTKQNYSRAYQCGMAEGYIAGAIDQMAEFTICPPMGVSMDEVKHILYQWLRKNPYRRNFNGASVVVVAMLESGWGCEVEPPAPLKPETGAPPGEDGGGAGG